MTMTATIIRSTLIATVALSMSAFAGAASAAQLKGRLPAPPPQQLGLKAAPGGGGQTQGHVETCNNKASCNLMISYCISNGDDWQETGIPTPQGEPQKGKCTYP